MSDNIEQLETAIQNCVRRFYEMARADELLGPVFNGAIADWDKHLKTMDDFWSSALLGTGRYRAAPFPPHLKLDMGQEHFARWRDVWTRTVKETLPEPIRGKAVSMAEHMAHCWGEAFVSLKQQMAEA